MTTERRKAPRREVKEIRRVGSWGNVEYHHVLVCGHIEKKPRASSAPKIACAWCLRTEAKELEMVALTQTVRPQIDDENLASEETEVKMAQASIASQFGVRADAVDVVTKDVDGVLQIRYATVFLTEKDVRRIAGQQT